MEKLKLLVNLYEKIKKNNTLMEEIKKLINKRDEINESLEIKVKELIKDKTIPLEDRFHIFIISDCGEEKPWIENFDSINEDDYYWYENRYRTVEISEFIDCVEDRENDETIDKFKQEVLDKFIKSFVIDW